MTLQSNYTVIHAPLFRKLSDDQIEKIHYASLEILERTGVRLYEPRAIELLKRKGVSVEDGNRVRIPPGLVEWALAIAPKRTTLYDRHGQRVMPLEDITLFLDPVQIVQM